MDKDHFRYEPLKIKEHREKTWQVISINPILILGLNINFYHPPDYLKNIDYHKIS